MHLGAPYRGFCLKAVVLIFSVAVTGQAQAQIKHIDYTAMNQRVSPQAAASYYMDPSSISSQLQPGMDRFVGKAPNMDKFIAINHANLPQGNMTMNNSPLNGKMDTASLWQKMYANPGNLTEKSYQQTTTRDPQMDSALQKFSSLNNSAQYDQLKQHQSGPSKYTDSFVFHTQDNNQPLQDVGHELSLQDINRYQFQGSHSNAPGLPSTHAGSNTDPTFSGSPLIGGPATFDGQALQGGRVLSGTSTQMRLITPNGSRPYQPMQLGSSNKSDLSGGASNQAVPPGYDTVYSQAQNLRNSRGAESTMSSSSSMPTGAFMPSGVYTPTTASGNALPLSFDAPKMIISVKKGGFVGMGDGKPAAGTTPQAQ